MSSLPFENFLNAFQKDLCEENRPDQTLMASDERAPLFEKLGGCSFNKGLYRVFSPSEAKDYDETIALAFPEYRDKPMSFGCDWLGRIYSLVKRGILNRKIQMVCFDVSIAKVLIIPFNIVSFHDLALVNNGDEALAKPYFKRWLEVHPAGLRPTHCAGYKLPLFLGGKDELDNLEDIDRDVYWSITSQIWQQVKNLPAGTKIDTITMDNKT